jgi:hypothetical protein
MSGERETMFETMFFLECPGMSQPLDSATPGRPPKVPFFWWERYVLCFYVKKIVPVDTLSASKGEYDGLSVHWDYHTLSATC